MGEAKLGDHAWCLRRGESRNVQVMASERYPYEVGNERAQKVS